MPTRLLWSGLSGTAFVRPLLAILLLAGLAPIATVAADAKTDAKTGASADAGADADSAGQPNIVLVLVDDMGWADVGCNNPDTFYETPNIDALAARGVRFTSGYAANPVCSPTRFSVMTGRYPTRDDVTNYFWGNRQGHFKAPDFVGQLKPEQVTVAERLREGGYRTAFFGKWHLGAPPQSFPENQGFEVNIGGGHHGMPKWENGFFAPYALHNLNEGKSEGEYLTERLVDEVLATIDTFQTETPDQPFFVDLSYYAVHVPILAPPELVEKYTAKAKRLGLNPEGEFKEIEQTLPPGRGGDQPRMVRTVQSDPAYAGMVEMVDRGVGRIVDDLKARGELDNTLFLFTSDNGGLATAEGSPTSNLPLAGGKGWVLEGGIREPFIVAGPGVAQGTTSDTPVCTIDILPTFLAAAGLEPQDGVDGQSLWPLLGDGQGGGAGDASDLTERDLFWHYPHYANQGGFPGSAIRSGKYKLVERLEDGRVHLYDLDADIGEQNDLSESDPERTAALRDRLHAWYRDVDAKFLQPGDRPDPFRPGQKVAQSK